MTDTDRYSTVPGSAPAAPTRFRPAALAWLTLLALSLAACSAGLDWRLTRLPGWGLEAALPCRPAQQQREVSLAGVRTDMHLAVCKVAQHTYAIGRADLAEPGQVDLVLRGLAQLAEVNLRGQVQHAAVAQVPGMTPQAGARYLRLAGVRADGQPVHMAVWLFARGLRVYQATVLGPQLTEQELSPLADSLKLTASP